MPSPPTRALTRLPPDATRINADTRALAFKMKMGELLQFGTGIDEIRLIFHGIEKLEEATYADLTFKTFLDSKGGESVKSKSRNRFLIPAVSTGLAATCAVFSWRLSTTSVDIDIFEISHINEHAGEIDGLLIRSYGSN